MKADLDLLDDNLLKFDEESIQRQKTQFDIDVKKVIMKHRLFAWNVHFIIMNMALILLVLSEHLEVFENL